MNDALCAVAALAATQDEIVTRAQAFDLGFSRSALQRHVQCGLLIPVGTRTYRCAGTKTRWHGLLRAGLLDLGDGALVAGRAAAALHRLDGFPEGPLEFVVPRSHRDRRTVGLVRSGPAVAPIDRCMVDGFPATSATLTIIHLAADGCRRDLANALDSAVRLRLVTPEVVHRRLSALRHRGLAGAVMLDEVLVEAGVESWLERRFLRLVRRDGLPEPTLQRTYRRDTTHVARVDFDFAPLPIIAEVGGQKGYLTRRERQRQELRRSQLQLIGKLIYFFSYEDVTEDPGYVLTTMRAALEPAA